MSNTTVSQPIENIMGTITFFCFVVGVPSNVLAMVYFYRDQKSKTRNVKKLFFTEQYLTMAVVDFLITITTFPIIEVFWKYDRKSVLFTNKIFCAAWGFLWEMLPYFSVYLVGILSISRMLVLLKPMMTLNIFTLRICTGSYFVSHLVFRVSLLVFDMIKNTDVPKGYTDSRFLYTNTSGYCYFYAVQDVLWTVNSFFQCTLLGLPMIPILVSCFLSILKLMKTPSGPKFNRDAQKQATVTIIIVTVVYICCNVPVFMNYIIYSIVLIKDVTSAHPEQYQHYYNLYIYNENIFWAWYIWSFTYVICAVINAAINPIIFFWRMKPFREFIIALFSFNRQRFKFKNTKAAMTGVSVKELTSSSF